MHANPLTSRMSPALLKFRACFFLHNNTLNLLFIRKIDITPDPHGDERQSRDGTSRNTHIPLRDAESNSNGISGLAANRVGKSIGVTRVHRCRDIGREALGEFARIHVRPDTSGDGVTDGAADGGGEVEEGEGGGEFAVGAGGESCDLMARDQSSALQGRY